MPFLQKEDKYVISIVASLIQFLHFHDLYVCANKIIENVVFTVINTSRYKVE